MQNRYTSYSIPAPVIKEPDCVVEDTAASMALTLTLVDRAADEIYELQDIARRMEQEPGRISPEAWKGRINGLAALTSAVAKRLKDDIILLDAVVAHRDEQRSGRERVS